MKQFFTFYCSGKCVSFFASFFLLSLTPGFKKVYGQTLYNYNGVTGAYTKDTSVSLSGTTNLATVGSATASPAPCADGFNVSDFPNDKSFSSAVEVDMFANKGDTFHITGFIVNLTRSGAGPDSIEFVYSPDGGATSYFGGIYYLPALGCDSKLHISWADTFSVPYTSYLIFDVFGFYADSTSGNLQILNLSINGKPSGIVDSVIDSVTSTACDDTFSFSGGDIFMHGEYVELGIDYLGAFASNSAPPSCYHPNIYIATYGATCLGLVADPDMDGWDVGTPNYFGDYWLPGSPVEGWCIQANGTRNDAYYQNYRFTSDYPTSGSTPTLYGSTVSYTNMGGVMTAVWQGTAYDSLSITQTTVLDTNNLYFVTTVNFKNSGSDTLTGIYYMRQCDPDNEAAETGSYTTTNAIDYSGPDTVLVSAVGTAYPPRSYLGIGTKSTNAKVFYCNSGLLPSESEGLDAIYHGTASDVSYTGSMIQDVGIGIVFSIGDLAPGDTASIVYTHILKESVIGAALGATGAGIDTTTTASVPVVSFEKGITISPNPAKNFIQIESNSAFSNTNIVVCDMNGRKILQTQLNLSKHTRQIPINLQDGVYVVELTSATGEKNIQRLVVLH